MLVALVGLVIERFLFRRFYREDPALGLLLTFGLAMVAEQTLRWIFGAAPLPFSIPPALKGQLLRRRLHLLEVPADHARDRGRGGRRLVVAAAAHAVRARRARGRAEPGHGRGARHLAAAVHDAPSSAISVALAALAGVLLAPITGVHPAMGAEILTASFVVVVIGGLGSFWGVVLAALIVGVVRGLTVYFFPAAAEASMYLLMLLVLLFRPRGLFGERIQRFE